jgi:hypothetical protein
MTDRWETIVVRLLPVLGSDAAPWTWINRRRSQHVSRPFPLNGVDALRERLKNANQRVEQSQRLVSGWRDLTKHEQAAGRDVSVGRDLLRTFEAGLEAAMSQQAEAEKALAHRLLDLFQGVRGRLPKNDQELHDWLASLEGKAATAFEPTSLSPWGEIGRS